MTVPCLGCGDPSSSSRCVECSTDTRVRDTNGQAAHDPRWRKLSLRARKAQPWCDDCGSTSDLTADHILPKVEFPELVHAIENLAIRCRSCNSRRSTAYTTAEAEQVVTRLLASYKRRPTIRGRERLTVAQRAAQTQGGGAQRTSSHPLGKAQSPSLLTSRDLEAAPSHRGDLDPLADGVGPHVIAVSDRQGRDVIHRAGDGIGIRLLVAVGEGDSECHDGSLS